MAWIKYEFHTILGGKPYLTYLSLPNIQCKQRYEQMSCLSDHASKAGEADDPRQKINAFRDTSGVIARLNGQDTIVSSEGTSFAATTECPEAPDGGILSYR